MKDHDFVPYAANPGICSICGAVRPMPCYESPDPEPVDSTRIGIELVLADVEKFIKRHRDEYDKQRWPVSWNVLDDLLEAFRMHVATGTPLDQELTQ